MSSKQRCRLFNGNKIVVKVSQVRKLCDNGISNKIHQVLRAVSGSNVQQLHTTEEQGGVSQIRGGGEVERGREVKREREGGREFREGERREHTHTHRHRHTQTQTITDTHTQTHRHTPGQMP